MITSSDSFDAKARRDEEVLFSHFLQFETLLTVFKYISIFEITVCMYVYMYEYIYICVHIYMYECIYAYVYKALTNLIMSLYIILFVTSTCLIHMFIKHMY